MYLRASVCVWSYFPAYNVIWIFVYAYLCTRTVRYPQRYFAYVYIYTLDYIYIHTVYVGILYYVLTYIAIFNKLSNEIFIFSPLRFTYSREPVCEYARKVARYICMWCVRVYVILSTLIIHNMCEQRIGVCPQYSSGSGRKRLKSPVHAHLYVYRSLIAIRLICITLQGFLCAGPPRRDPQAAVVDLRFCTRPNERVCVLRLWRRRVRPPVFYSLFHSFIHFLNARATRVSEM